MSDASKIDDGGPAFPCDELDQHGYAERSLYAQHNGLSRRDYFAAAALTGMLTRTDYDNITAAEIADTALCYADALIAASKSEAQNG